MGALGYGEVAAPGTVPWAVERLLSDIAARRATDAGQPLAHLSSEDFASLIDELESHRLIGCLAEMVADGHVQLADDRLTALTERHAEWASQAVLVERVLQRAADAFAGAGLDVVVLKGVATAHLAYTDPSWRVFLDLDLLVRSTQFNEAASVAESALAATRAFAELRPGFDEEFGKEIMLRVGTIDLDLHRTLVEGPFGLTIDVDQLFVATTTLCIGDRTYRTLSPNHLFLHACYSAALGDFPPRLGTLADIVAIWEHLDVHLDAVAATARQWSGTAVLRRAAELTISLLRLGSEHPLAALTTIEVPRRQAWLLRQYVSPGRSTRVPLACLAVIEGVRPRGRYLRAIIAPSTAYLRGRDQTMRTHVTRHFTGVFTRHRG